MNCPACGAPYESGQRFCVSCGAQLPEEAAVESPAEVTAQDVAATEAPPVAPEPAGDDAQAAYEAEYARYQAEYAAWQAGQAQQAPTAQAPAYPAPQTAAAAAPAAPAPKKRKTGLIIAIVAIVLFLLVAAGAAVAVLGLVSFSKDTATSTVQTIETPVEAAAPTGFATAEAAIQAKLPEYGSDWVYQVHEETDDTVTYWVGPPASEFAAAVIVSKGSDGSWSVTSEEALDFAGDVQDPNSGADGTVSPAEEALAVVNDHLNAVMEDRGMDAHALTVDPFASDGASAQMANGEFKSFDIQDATEQSDGSFWVKTTQTWTWGTEKWQYWVVPTEAGYRIADLKAW